MKDLDKDVEQRLDELIESILVEAGTEPDGQNLWVIKSEELEKILRSVLKGSFLAQELALAKEEGARSFEKIIRSISEKDLIRILEYTYYPRFHWDEYDWEDPEINKDDFFDKLFTNPPVKNK